MVKCCNCGFLAVRNTGNNDLVEVPTHWRRDGQIPDRFDATPICLKKAFPLNEEMRGTEHQNRSRVNLFVEVINKDRECLEFYEWRQGHSPKEHREMQQADQLRDWQRRVELEDRAYRDEQRQRDLDREEKQRKEDRDYRDRQDAAMRRQFWLTFTIGMILIPLVAALLQNVSSWLATKQPAVVAPALTNQPPPDKQDR